MKFANRIGHDIDKQNLNTSIKIHSPNAPLTLNAIRKSYVASQKLNVTTISKRINPL